MIDWNIFTCTLGMCSICGVIILILVICTIVTGFFEAVVALVRGHPPVDKDDDDDDDNDMDDLAELCEKVMPDDGNYSIKIKSDGDNQSITIKKGD